MTVSDTPVDQADMPLNRDVFLRSLLRELAGTNETLLANPVAI